MKKLSFLKITTIFITLITFLNIVSPIHLITFANEIENESKRTITRVYNMTTSDDPLRFTEFTLSGDTISLNGIYRKNELRKISIDGQNINLTLNSDGSFSATHNGARKAKGTSYITLSVMDGDIQYRIDYDDEWYFQNLQLDSGETLILSNSRLIKEYNNIPSEVVTQYLSGNDSNNAQSVQNILNEISRLGAEITSGIESDFEKARAISDWVANNIHYDRDARDTNVDIETIAIKNVIKHKKTTCAGYANLTAALLSSVGIKAITVIGSAISLDKYEESLDLNNHHEWTAFLDSDTNNWITIDAGWDSSNSFELGLYSKERKPIKYFAISGAAFAQNHKVVKAEYRDYFACLDSTNTDNSSKASESGDEVDNTTDTSNAVDENSGISPLIIIILIICIAVSVVVIIVLKKINDHKFL